MAVARTKASRIVPCSFQDLLPSWQKDLWPGRLSPIESLSMIAPDGTIDMKLADIARAHPPLYLRLLDDQERETLGTLQGQWTAPRELRLRGWWVHPDLRGQGWGKRLIEELERQASPQRLWVMSRMSAVSLYEASGLREYGRVSGYEFGPHVLMAKDL